MVLKVSKGRGKTMNLKGIIKKMILPLIVISSIFLFGSLQVDAAGHTYYVSQSGNDANSGAIESPFKSIQYGVEQLTAGDTLLIRAGVYSEKIKVVSSGSEVDKITISAYPNESVTLDGTNLKMDSDMDALVYIYDQSNIVIKGLELCDFVTTKRGTCIGGILVDGQWKNIELRNNRIHDIWNLATVDASKNGRDAHGIGVYGSSTETATGLVIDSNEIYNCALGSSEAMAVNGNIEQFEVTNNKVYQNDNIGICFIGYEGVCKDVNLDRARNGICTGNIVYDIDSYNNPAYGTDRSAGGIYCDGATNIVIANNQVKNANFGIELASEHKGKDTSFITVENNVVAYCSNAGLAMGGYDKKRGYSLNNVIRNNVFYSNDMLMGSFGEVFLQFTAKNNQLTNNLFYANAQSLFVYDAYSTNEGNSMDYNTYYCVSGAENAKWRWKKVDTIGFENYRQKTGNDLHSEFKELAIEIPEPVSLTPKYTKIVVDGKDFDWKEIASFVKVTTSYSRKMKLTHNDEKLFVCLIGTNFKKYPTIELYFNTDENTQTGYSGLSKITTQGFEYVLKNGVLYQYVLRDTTWELVEVADSMATSRLARACYEVAIPMQSMSIAQGSKIQVAYITKDKKGIIKERLPRSGSLKQFVIE